MPKVEIRYKSHNALEHFSDVSRLCYQASTIICDALNQGVGLSRKSFVAAKDVEVISSPFDSDDLPIADCNFAITIWAHPFAHRVKNIDKITRRVRNKIQDYITFMLGIEAKLSVWLILVPMSYSGPDQ